MSETVNAKAVRAALGAASAFGRDAGVPADALELAEAWTDVDARLPHAAWTGLWEEISRRTGRESSGIDAAKRPAPSSTFRPATAARPGPPRQGPGDLPTNMRGKASAK